MGVGIFFPDMAKKRYSVHVRHIKIRDDGLDIMTLQILKCIQPVKTYMYSEKTGLLQIKLEDIRELPIVINKEYGDN
jgi:hypothetical protein